MTAGTIEKTEGIVLRVTPFSTTSHVVVWLTPDRGRLPTAIKGIYLDKMELIRVD